MSNGHTKRSKCDSKSSRGGKKRKDIRWKRKGDKDRKRTQFPKGKATRYFGPWPEKKEYNNEPKPIKRHEKQFLSDVAVKTPAHDLSIPAANGEDGDAMILRAVSNTQTEDVIDPCNNRQTGTGEYEMERGYMLIEKSLMLDGINEFIKVHDGQPCDNLDLDMIKLQPWGLYTSVVFYCKTCTFANPKRDKLYDEVNTNKPGRKAAEGNLRLVALLQDLGIGPTEIQLALAAIGLHVNITNLQKSAVKVSEITESLARKDMAHWLQYATEIYKARGVANEDQMSAEFDVLYHAMNRSNSHCPGQAASAATALCVETVTPKKKIVEFEHSVRVCTRGSNLRVNNIATVCGHASSKAHHSCTATIPPGQIIREYDMAFKIAQRLKSQGKAVTHLVSDSDAKGRDGFVDVNQTDPTLPVTTWYKDPSHTSRNMRKKISLHSVAGKLFGKRKDGSQWSYPEKLECRKALALDVPKRVSLTLSNMRIFFKGDFVKMSSKVEAIAEYMVKCYGGDHTHCSSSRLAKLTGCSGPSKGRCWFSRSHVLKAQGVCSLDLSSQNQKFLLSVIGMKLSKESLGYFARGETSSKCEVSNRAMNKSLPKNRNFWRTGIGRISSAILRINNGFLKSTTMKFEEMGVPLPDDSQAGIVFRKYERKRVMTRSSQKTKSYQERRHNLIAQRAARYFRQRTKDTNESDYLKYQLDEAREASTQAINDIALSDDPVSLERDLKRASSLADHLQTTVEHTYAKTGSIIAKKREVKRRRKAAQQQRCLRQQEQRLRTRQTTLKAGQSKARRDTDSHYYRHRK